MKSVSPQLERRRALRRQKRTQFLIYTWRTLSLLSLSTVLGWSLLRFGWTLKGSDQVVVRGETTFNSTIVSEVAQFNFPQLLLEINPSELEQTLRENLPIQSVQVSRHMLPTRLEVALVDQTPVAQAIRQQPGGLEAGYVDAEGHWIRINPAAPAAVPITAITVKGWTPERRSLIAALLQQNNRLNGQLRTITLHPDGAVSLRHRRLGRIDLGDDHHLLTQQVDAIVELNQSMPPHLLQANGAVIDLSNLRRPEIQMPIKPPAKTMNN